jgi:hypothetical protein
MESGFSVRGRRDAADLNHHRLAAAMTETLLENAFSHPFGVPLS